MGVRSEGETSEEAFAAADERATAVQDAITAAGVAEDDIQTQDLRLDKRTENRGEPDEHSFYVAEQRFEVKVRDVNDTGKVAGAAVGAGANIVGGIEFQLSDKEPTRNDALKDAVQTAHAKAEAMASAAGATVGDVVVIDETNTTFDTVHRSLDQSLALQAQLAPSADAYTAAEVSPGQVETKVEVTIIYELQPA